MWIKHYAQYGCAAGDFNIMPRGGITVPHYEARFGMGQMNPLLSSLLNTVLVIVVCVPVFYFVERINPIVPGQKFYRKEYFADLLYAVSNGGFVMPVLQLLCSLFFFEVVGKIVPFQFFARDIEALPLIVQVFLALLLIDFITYWRHRFAHIHAWPFHAVHHSAEEIDWLTKFRGHPGDVFLSTFFFAGGAHVLGFGGLGFLIAMIIYYAYDLAIHCNLKFGFKGWLRYVIATPQFHRWHHAVEPQAINKNYCVIFAFYDWIFGSFYCPSGVFPSGYGLSPQAQKNYPTDFLAQQAYPFRKFFRRWKKKEP